MDRRRFLATSTAVSALSLSGCTALGVGTTNLRPADTKTEPIATHLQFEQGDRKLLVFSTRYLDGYDESTGRIPIEFDVWHAEETRIESFRFDVRAPANEREPLTTVALETPFGSAKSLDFYESDGRETVVAADDLGEYGDSTFSLSLSLDPQEMPETLPIHVRGTFDLTETGFLGGEYHLEGQTTVEVTRDQGE